MRRKTFWQLPAGTNTEFTEFERDPSDQADIRENPPEMDASAVFQLGISVAYCIALLHRVGREKNKYYC